MTKIRFFTPLFVVLLFLVSAAPRMALASGALQDSYPPPAAEPTPLPADGVVPELDTGDPYPSGGTDFSPLAPVPIGVQTSDPLSPTNPTGDSTANSTIDQESGERGLVFLWLGFVATFLVLMTSMVGSIILFTRRNES
jgi:hypothetical protein